LFDSWGQLERKIEKHEYKTKEEMNLQIQSIKTELVALKSVISYEQCSKCNKNYDLTEEIKSLKNCLENLLERNNELGKFKNFITLLFSYHLFNYCVATRRLCLSATLFSPVEDKTAGFGLAGATIAGATGLAEPNQLN